MAGWKDIYDANSDEMSTYIHSDWRNFYNMIENQSKDISTLEKKIKEEVFDSFKQVVKGMIERELDFFLEVEQAYLEFVNNNLQIIGEKPYKNIQDLRKALEDNQKDFLNKEDSILKSLVDVSVGAQEYRKLKEKHMKQINKIKDPVLKAKAESDIEEEINFKVEQQEWATKLFKAIVALAEYLERKIAIFQKEPTKDIYNLASSLEKYRDLIIALLQYGKKNNLIQGPITDKFLSDLKSKGSPMDLLEIISNMNTKSLTYELTSPAFKNKEGKFTTPQMSKKLGDMFELLYPEIITEIGMDGALLGFEQDKKTVKKMQQTGEAYKNFNISDKLFAQVKTSKGQIINVGASLKLKAEDSTNSEYVITNLWEGKLGEDTFKTSEEQKLVDKASIHKNFINWMKNNIISLSSFSVDGKSSNTAASDFIDQITSLEAEVATLLLLPRFFNGFLKELKDGTFAAFDATAMEDIPPLAFTVFVVSNEKVFLTSDLIRIVWKSFAMGTEVKGFKSSTKGWEGDRAFLQSKNKVIGLSEKLWKAKQKAWENIENISYILLMKNEEVKSVLNRINNILKYRSLSSKVYYDINFEKVIGGQ